MKGINKFGKKEFENERSNSAAIAASKGWVTAITKAEKKNYAPFTNLTILNRSESCNLQIKLNAIILGDNTLSYSVGQTRTLYLPASKGLEMIWKDDKILCYALVIKNISGGTVAIGEVIVKFSNYTNEK